MDSVFGQHLCIEGQLLEQNLCGEGLFDGSEAVWKWGQWFWAASVYSDFSCYIASVWKWVNCRSSSCAESNHLLCQQLLGEGW